MSFGIKGTSVLFFHLAGLLFVATVSVIISPPTIPKNPLVFDSPDKYINGTNAPFMLLLLGLRAGRGMVHFSAQD
jgi:hypothetical protein